MKAAMGQITEVGIDSSLVSEGDALFHECLSGAGPGLRKSLSLSPECQPVQTALS